MALNRPYSRQPILVWTMGKVASSTISYSLFMAGLYTLDIHSLQNPLVTQPDAARDEESSQERLPHHVLRSRRALEIFEMGSEPIEIITAVREPVARNLSAFFQNLKRSDVEGKSADEVIGMFKTGYKHSIPLDWFDNEILARTGVDLLLEPFDIAQRWSIVETGRFRFLVIRLDGREAVMQEGLQQFLGEPVFIANQNESRGKFYDTLYRDVKRQIRFDLSELKPLYNSKYCKAFWTPKERKEMRQSWVLSE